MAEKPKLENGKLVKLIVAPKIEDDGYLYFAQYPDHIPFKITRVYYITKPRSGLSRGKHAHRKTSQILFCIQGKVRMVLDNGYKKERITLKRPEYGLLLPPLIWHEMLGMDEDTILLVFASKKFDPKDYIRDYNKFLAIARRKR